MATARFVKMGITPDEMTRCARSSVSATSHGWGARFTRPRLVTTERFESLRYGTRVNRLRPGGEKVMVVRTEAGFGDGPPSIEYLDVHKVVQR